MSDRPERGHLGDCMHINARKVFLPPREAPCRPPSSCGGLGHSVYTNCDTSEKVHQRLKRVSTGSQSTFSDMSTPYAFEFSDGSKKYTLVCTVESPGVQPRFTLALTDGTSGWTSDGKMHGCLEKLKQCTCAWVAFRVCVLV